MKHVERSTSDVGERGVPQIKPDRKGTNPDSLSISLQLMRRDKTANPVEAPKKGMDGCRGNFRDEEKARTNHITEQKKYQTPNKEIKNKCRDAKEEWFNEQCTAIKRMSNTNTASVHNRIK